ERSPVPASSHPPSTKLHPHLRLQYPQTHARIPSSVALLVQIPTTGNPVVVGRAPGASRSIAASAPSQPLSNRCFASTRSGYGSPGDHGDISPARGSAVGGLREILRRDDPVLADADIGGIGDLRRLQRHARADDGLLALSHVLEELAVHAHFGRTGRER